MSAPRLLTVTLEDQGIARSRPSDLGRCEHIMARDRQTRFGPNGVTHSRPWRKRCPNAATVVIHGRFLCDHHAARPTVPVIT